MIKPTLNTLRKFKNNKHKYSIQNIKQLKLVKVQQFRKSFNTQKKHYRPFFKKRQTLNLITKASENLNNFLLNFEPLSNYGLEIRSLKTNSRSFLVKPSNFYLPAKCKFDSNLSKIELKTTKQVQFGFPKTQTNLINTLIDYYLSMYLLRRSNLHSKKAAVIIAQIIDAGHFSKRTVYLSSTQSVFLKHKVKLTHYLSEYSYSPVFISPESITPLNALRPRDFNFLVSQNRQTLCISDSNTNINNLRLLENNLVKFLNLLWTQKVTRQNKTSRPKFSRTLMFKHFLKKNRYLPKNNLLHKQRTLFFTLRKSIRLVMRTKINFLWQKKRMNWASKRRNVMQYFNTFSTLPWRQKKLLTELDKSLPNNLHKISAFTPFNYSNLRLKALSSEKNKPSLIFNGVSLPLSTIPTQLSMFYLFQPWLLTTLNESNKANTQSNRFLLSLRTDFNPLYTNLQPHHEFKHIILKKILSLFSTNKIREDIIPFYYNTLVRFMEHCSGKKILIQLYPFLNQSISYDYIVRYKSWITRMKSYERRLGHKFFFEEALHIMHLSFTLRDVLLFSSWLKAMILRISFWKTRTIFRFLRYLFLIYFVHIFPELQIKGLKIRLKGKISAAGNSRKRTILYRVGQTSHSELNLRVSHSKQTINTFTGVMGFQVWLFY